MRSDEFERQLNARTGTEQRVYAALRERGPMSDMQLREFLGSRGSGPRDALKKLLPIGFVRLAGRAGTHGKPWLYEATLPSDVETAAESYAARTPKRKRRKASTNNKLSDLRRMQPGDFREWHAVRQRILSQTKLLTRVDTMAFWETAPLDELELVLEEVVELQDWAEDVIASIGERSEHEAIK